MFILQKQRINQVELDGTVFEDIYYVKVFEAENKQSIRKHIKERYNDKGTFRMIAPGGAVSNPMNIRLQEEGKKPRSIDRNSDRLLHRICDDYDPIVVPTNPVGRMQWIAKALREE